MPKCWFNHLIANKIHLFLKEKDVLRGIAKGKSYAKNALNLFIIKETVRTQIANIYQKLAVNSKTEALNVAGENKWLS